MNPEKITKNLEKPKRRRRGDGAKFRIWKYFGAMFMEEKDGHQALSFTRGLGFLLFLFCVGGWSLQMFWPMTAQLPEMAIYTLWGLLGLKGGKDVATGLGGR